MNLARAISSFLSTWDNWMNFTYFDAIDLIQSHEASDSCDIQEFHLSPFTGLDQYGPRGCQPLHYAIQSKSQRAINWILSQGPPLNSLTEIKGWNSAHCAVIENDSKTLGKLIELGVDLNSLDWVSLTPLAYAENDLEFENWSDQLGFHSINFEIPLGHHKRSYLHYFSKDSTLKLLNYAIEANPLAINKPDESGTTSLMFAAEFGQVEALRLLISKGAILDQIDEMGRMAIHRAAAAGQLSACKCLLLQNEVINEEFYIEIRYENDSHLSIHDLSGMTPLMLAIINGHVDTVRFLCTFSEHLNLAHTRTGDTALHFAVRKSSPEMVSILLDAYADPDPKNAEGKKPFDLIASNFSEDSLESEIFTLLAEVIIY